MGIKVETINGKLCVVIPPEYKEPQWVDSMYKNTVVRDDTKGMIIPTRPCNVQITKPTMVQTPMGYVQQNQVTTELWEYFDVPQLSIIVKDGEDLLETWSLNDLKLELKETQQLEGAKKDEDTNLS